ncbi:MAG: exopolysaccharide biosynthesis protein [Alphaproteobacteria bacterium]|nr:exopolysaccharide biosynthesis protein [Alphaproteobacteria bacterium]
MAEEDQSLEVAEGSGKADDDHRSTSQILLALVQDHGHERISVRDLLEGLGERGFGFAFLMFAIPAAMPGPPGFGSLFGIPLMMFAGQMVMRMPSPWLPAFIADRSFARSDLEKIVRMALPYMQWVERLCKPRLDFAVLGVGEVLLGLLVFILAFVLFLPGPGTNFLPGISILFLSIALIERDGLLVLLGTVFSFAMLVLAVWGVWLFIVEIIPFAWMWILWFWDGIVGLFG